MTYKAFKDALGEHTKGMTPSQASGKRAWIAYRQKKEITPTMRPQYAKELADDLRARNTRRATYRVDRFGADYGEEYVGKAQAAIKAADEVRLTDPGFRASDYKASAYPGGARFAASAYPGGAQFAAADMGKLLKQVNYPEGQPADDPDSCHSLITGFINASSLFPPRTGYRNPKVSESIASAILPMTSLTAGASLYVMYDTVNPHRGVVVYQQTITGVW